MIPDDFAATGLHVAGNGTRPTRFQVLGERSSGTNYVKRLLGRNTQLTPTEALGWKHGHPHATAIPADLAVICVTRHAVPWALSMHAKPWHCPPAMQALAFSDFIRAPWETVVDRAKYFDGAADLLGQPLQLDRDPVTGLAYPDLAALRGAKLRGLISYANRGCTFVLLRMEEATARPDRGHVGAPERSPPRSRGRGLLRYLYPEPDRVRAPRRNLQRRVAVAARDHRRLLVDLDLGRVPVPAHRTPVRPAPRLFRFRHALLRTGVPSQTDRTRQIRAIRRAHRRVASGGSPGRGPVIRRTFSR